MVRLAQRWLQEARRIEMNGFGKDGGGRRSGAVVAAKAGEPMKHLSKQRWLLRTTDRKVCVMKKRYADGVVPAEAVSARAQVASQLKAARCSVNLSQQNLAKMCGTKKSNISRMESGRYNPSLDFLVKVASSLGMEVSVQVR